MLGGLWALSYIGYFVGVYHGLQLERQIRCLEVPIVQARLSNHAVFHLLVVIPRVHGYIVAYYILRY